MSRKRRRQGENERKNVVYMSLNVYECLQVLIAFPRFNVSLLLFPSFHVYWWLPLLLLLFVLVAPTLFSYPASRERVQECNAFINCD